MFKNPIIVFEGIEGSGKSFHIKNVENHFKKHKVKYIIRAAVDGLKNQKSPKIIAARRSKKVGNITSARESS